MFRNRTISLLLLVSLAFFFAVPFVQVHATGYAYAVVEPSGNWYYLSSPYTGSSGQLYEITGTGYYYNGKLLDFEYGSKKYYYYAGDGPNQSPTYVDKTEVYKFPFAIVGRGSGSKDPLTVQKEYDAEVARLVYDATRSNYLIPLSNLDTGLYGGWARIYKDSRNGKVYRYSDIYPNGQEILETGDGLANLIANLNAQSSVDEQTRANWANDSGGGLLGGGLFSTIVSVGLSLIGVPPVVTAIMNATVTGNVGIGTVLSLIGFPQTDTFGGPIDYDIASFVPDTGTFVQTVAPIIDSSPILALDSFSSSLQDSAISSTNGITNSIANFGASAFGCVTNIGECIAGSATDESTVAPNPTVTTAPAPIVTSSETTVNSVPQGVLDSTNCNTLTGWAFDQDSPNKSIDVHLYKDGPPGTGTIVGGFTADASRPDVNTAYSTLDITGKHGFLISTPDSLKDGVSHSLYFFAIDTAGGGNPLIGSSSITCASPTPSTCPSGQTGTPPNCVTPSSTGGIRGTFTSWFFSPPSTVSGFNDLEWDITVNKDTYPAYYFYSTQFDVSGGGGGYFGFMSMGNGYKIAIFKMWPMQQGILAESSTPGATVRNGVIGCPTDPNCGEPDYSSIELVYNWQAGRKYNLKIERDSGNAANVWWKASITDTVTGIITIVGRMKTPPTYTEVLKGGTLESFLENIEVSRDSILCENIVKADVSYTNMTANNGTYHISSLNNHLSGGPSTLCPGSYELNIPNGARQVVGDSAYVPTSTEITPVATVPDLTAGATVATPNSVTVGQRVTFSANVSNIGTATASKSPGFPNTFQIVDGAMTPQSLVRINASPISSLATGASMSVSGSYTFSLVGTYKVRACANINTSWNRDDSVIDSDGSNDCGTWIDITVTAGAIPTTAPTASLTVNGLNKVTVTVGESNTKVWNGTPGSTYSSTYSFSDTPGSTCALADGKTYDWSGSGGYNASGSSTGAPYISKAGCTATITYTVTNSAGSATDTLYVTVVAKVPTGSLTLSPTSCVIASGESTCRISASWNTSNTIAPALLDGNTGATLLPTGSSSSGLAVWVAYPQTVFNLKDGNTLLDTKTATASCATGSAWNGSSCAAVPAPTASITTYSGPYVSGFVGSSDLTLNIGEQNTIVWSGGPPGSTASSQYRYDNSPGYTCGFTTAPGTWIPWGANDLSGNVISAPGQPDSSKVGCTVIIVYSVINTGITTSSTVTRHLNPPPTPATPVTPVTPIISPAPVPVTASLTITDNTHPNGDPHNVTLTVGDSNTKTWSSTGGTSWTSTVVYSGSCSANSNGTNNTPYTWVAGNTASGSSSSAGALASNAGCTTAITYTVTNDAGQSASDTIHATTVAAPISLGSWRNQLAGVATVANKIFEVIKALFSTY